MSFSTALSKLSRLTLLSLFCAGLFVSVGDLRVGSGGVEIGGGVDVVMAACDKGQVPATDGGCVAEGSTLAATTPIGGVTPPAADSTEGKKDMVSTVINGLADLSNVVIKLLSIFLTPLIMLSGWLLSPDWTFGEIFGLRPILHKLWILISNVVYVIFGFMLVFVAFANIFGGEHAKAYEMKTMLPKLVTGMLMVPFTWFIVSATLSVANLLTASVIQLPVSTIHMAGGDKAKEFFDQKKIIPKKMTLDLRTEGTTGSGNTINCSTTPDECLSISAFLSDASGGGYNLLSVYAYGIFHVDKYMDITKNQLTSKSISAVVDIVKKLGFGIIFFVVFGILVIAIVYALFTRAIMLWMYAIFSPLFALNYVLGDKLKDKGADKFTIKEFISLAMVPVYVSAALAFGLMFLSLVMNKDDYTKTGMVAKVDSEKGSGKQTFKIGGENGMTLTTIGDPNLVDELSNTFETGQGLIGSVIMGFLGLVILWMAVMAALGASKITGAAVKPIQEMGHSVGQLAMKAPQYVPLPLPGGSISGAGKVVNTLTNIPDQIAAAKAADSSISKSFGQYTENIRTRSAVEAGLRDGLAQSELGEIQGHLKKMLSASGSNDVNFKAAFQKYAEAAQEAKAFGNLDLKNLQDSNGRLSPDGVKILTNGWNDNTINPNKAQTLATQWLTPGTKVEAAKDTKNDGITPEIKNNDDNTKSITIKQGNSSYNIVVHQKDGLKTDNDKKEMYDIFKGQYKDGAEFEKYLLDQKIAHDKPTAEKIIDQIKTDDFFKPQTPKTP